MYFQSIAAHSQWWILLQWRGIMLIRCWSPLCMCVCGGGIFVFVCKCFSPWCARKDLNGFVLESFSETGAWLLTPLSGFCISSPLKSPMWIFIPPFKPFNNLFMWSASEEAGISVYAPMENRRARESDRFSEMKPSSAVSIANSHLCRINLANIYSVLSFCLQGMRSHCKMNFFLWIFVTVYISRKKIAQPNSNSAVISPPSWYSNLIFFRRKYLEWLLLM